MRFYFILIFLAVSCISETKSFLFPSNIKITRDYKISPKIWGFSSKVYKISGSLTVDNLKDYPLEKSLDNYMEGVFFHKWELYNEDEIGLRVRNILKKLYSQRMKNDTFMLDFKNNLMTSKGQVYISYYYSPINDSSNKTNEIFYYDIYLFDAKKNKLYAFELSP